jgi:uncharacterized protein YheU (UPF0270 family)
LSRAFHLTTRDAVDEPTAIEVPCSALSNETLERLITEFVTRDGTDYGGTERPLADKIADVRRQLARGEAKIVYDPESETANIVPAKPR